MVQWLRLHALNAGDTGSNPGLGTKIPYAIEHSQNKIKINTFSSHTARCLVWKKHLKIVECIIQRN